MDPVSLPYFSEESSNPFLGKKILVLSGGQDKIVPWSTARDFVERLEVGKEGRKKSVVVEDAGHACTLEMVAEMVQFIKDEAVQWR
jgi:predicted esterase